MDPRLQALIVAYKIIKDLRFKATLGAEEKKNLLDQMKYLATVIIKHGGKL